MNNWLRDFFHKNAWAILVFIGGLVGTAFVMRRDVQAIIQQIDRVTPRVEATERVNGVQDEAIGTIKRDLGDMKDDIKFLVREAKRK